MPGPTPEQFNDITRTQSRITSDNIIILMSMVNDQKHMPHGIDAMAQADQNLIELKFNPRIVENSAICPSLAHEHGHILSFRAGTMRNMKPADNLLMSMQLPLAMLLISEHGWEEIIAEEVRAWDYARTTLESIVYKDWSGFEATKKACLETYYLTQKEASTISVVQKDHVRTAIVEDFILSKAGKKPAPIIKTIDIDLDKYVGKPNIEEIRVQIAEECVKVLKANGIQ